MIVLKGKYTDAKIFIDDIEEGVYQQVYDIINSPTSKGLKVRLMPDCHVGANATVGMTMELGNFLNVSVVGCDIGCGLNSAKFSKELKIDFNKAEALIKKAIPTGHNLHESPVVTELNFDEIQRLADAFILKYNDKFGTSYVAPTYSEKWLSDKLKDIKMDESKFWKAIGSMGGNNHYVEVGRSENTGDYWVTVHSGSRNLGLKIFDYWNNIANSKVKVASDEYNKELDEILHNTFPKNLIPQKVRELKEKHELGINKGYLSGDNLIGYIFDMLFTQYYALQSRKAMLEIIRVELGIDEYLDTITTIHNYIDMDDLIVRKGAVKSYQGQRFLLPFNMRDGMLILNGKSNSDWNFSSPHGSGRKFSRSHAKQNLDYDEYKKSMEGIITTSVDKSTIDESPQSYKSSKLIEELIQDTATVIDRVKPVLNIKDTGKSISWKERKQEKKKRDLDRMNERKMKRGE